MHFFVKIATNSVRTKKKKRSGLLFVRSKPENKKVKKKNVLKLKYSCCG